MLYVVTAKQVLQKVKRRVYDVGDFYQRLYEEMNRAQRYRRPLTLALLSFSLPEKRNRDDLNLSQAINKAIRLPDIVGHLSEQATGLILVETAREGSRDVLRRIRQTLDDHPAHDGIRTHIGLASFSLSVREDTYFPPEAAGSFMNHAADLLDIARSDEQNRATRPFYADTWRSDQTTALSS